MSHEIVVQVQRSFKDVAPIADEVGWGFYARLFETHPELRPLFAEDIRPQSRKLVQMLAMVVNGLHRLDAIGPELEELARLHREHGVIDVHYAMVCDALVWTLGEALGEAFTPQARQAWTTAFTALADLMIAAAGEPTSWTGGSLRTRRPPGIPLNRTSIGDIPC